MSVLEPYDGHEATTEDLILAAMMDTDAPPVAGPSTAPAAPVAPKRVVKPKVKVSAFLLTK